MSTIPACVQCGTQLRWFVEQKSWGCDRCQKLFPVGAHQPVGPNPWVAPPRRRRKWPVVVGALLVVAGGATTGLVLTRNDGEVEPTAAQPAKPTDAAIAKPEVPDASGSGGSGSTGSGTAKGTGSGSAEGTGSGSASAGSGSAKQVGLAIPKACKEYKAALEKLVVCKQLPSKSRDGLKQELEHAKAWTNPTTPDAEQAMAEGCKRDMTSIKKSRSACRPGGGGTSF